MAGRATEALGARQCRTAVLASAVRSSAWQSSVDALVLYDIAGGSKSTKPSGPVFPYGA
jgi:hypothetical protein